MEWNQFLFDHFTLERRRRVEEHSQSQSQSHTASFMSIFRHFLAALAYPAVGSFHLEDLQSVQALVLWLENYKIRALDIEERRGLKQVNDVEAWMNAFDEYLAVQDCPVKEGSKNMEESVRWLLDQAIFLEYKDRREELRNVRPQESQRDVWPSTSKGKYQDLSSDAFKSNVSKLARTLGIAEEGKGIGQILQEANKKLSNLQSPAFQLAAKEHARLHSLQDDAMESTEEMESLPLGFDSGDPVLNNAATVLRLLYVQDLRRLQTFIDETIVQVQEWTANPKTDAKLGKVGR